MSIAASIAALRRPLAVAACFVALVVAVEHEVLPLLAWTRRVFPVSGLDVAFCVLFFGWLAQRHAPAAWRPRVLLAASLTLVAWFSVGFLIVFSAWIFVFHRVLGADVAHRFRALFVAATCAGWMIACHVPLAPRFHLAHPVVLAWGYVFAAGMLFRVVWLLHQAKISGERLSLRELFTYLLFAPFFVVLPYMFAIPEPAAFRAALARHDRDVERSGLWLLIHSMLLGTALYLATTYLWSPRDAFEAALRERRLWHAAIAGLAYYPGEVVAIAVSGSGVLIGLVRLFGVPLGLSFDRPLLSRDINEWWQRWNTHFRDLLVALCWYPVVFRLRRRPYASIWAGCASVFLGGSVLLHWVAKHPFHHGSASNLPFGIFFESIAMTIVVGASMSWAAWRKRRGAPPRRAGLMALAAARLRTYALVFVTVVGVGNGATYLLAMHPFEQLVPLVARAQALVASGRIADAADVLAPLVARLRELALDEPLDPRRQSAAALALALPGEARDEAAAATHLALATTFGDPRDGTARAWIAVAASLIEPETP